MERYYDHEKARYIYKDDPDYDPPDRTFSDWLDRYWGWLAAAAVLPLVAAGVYGLIRIDEGLEEEQVEKNVTACEKVDGTLAEFSEVTKCMVNGHAVATWYHDGSMAGE